MKCHCFLRPIRRDLTNSSYATALLGMHKNHGRQNEGRRPFVLDKKAMAMANDISGVKCCGYDVRLGCMWCINESKTIRKVSGRFAIKNRT